MWMVTVACAKQSEEQNSIEAVSAVGCMGFDVADTGRGHASVNWGCIAVDCLVSSRFTAHLADNYFLSMLASFVARLRLAYQQELHLSGRAAQAMPRICVTGTHCGPFAFAVVFLLDCTFLSLVPITDSRFAASTSCKSGREGPC